MADRFPSIEDIDDGDTEVRDTRTAGVDVEDDFLSRERAALGDDAAQFATSGDRTATTEDVTDDLLGEDFGTAQTDGQSQQFESAFPPISARNESIGPGGTITGSSAPQTHSGYSQPEEEPEVISEWRERRDLALQHRAGQSEKKKEATVKEAQSAVDDFYDNYNTKKEKGIAQTRKDADEFMANREDTSSGGTSWERIAKLVDLSGKGNKGGATGSGKEKFKELLTNLRKDENAPGASGV